MAGADLLINVAMDVSMVVGVGEGLRVAYVGAKVAGHVAADVGEHALAHAGEDAVEHVAEHEAEDVAEHAAEDVGASCAMSFAASTLVLTPTGARAIAALHAGAQVIAYNPTTHTSSSQTVEATSIHHDNNLVDVTLRVPAAKGVQSASKSVTTSTHSEVVHTTANHPWLSADHGWQIASFLHVGEPVRRADGSVATVTRVQSVPGVADMWDLTVSQVHTFAVGTSAFVVHNCGPNGKPDASQLGDGQDYYYEGQRRDGLKNQGWKRTRNIERDNDSQSFRDFIKSRRDSDYVFDDSKWKYHIETWKRGGASFENHYWENVGEDEMWHHHNPGDFLP